MQLIERGSRCAHPGRESGFTLMEALLAAMTLALLATGISSLYLSGMQTLDVHLEKMLIDSRLRSEMEIALAKDFDQVSSTEYAVDIDGKSCTVSLTAEFVDLDKDGSVESDAKKVTLKLEGRTLSTLIVTHNGAVSKIL